MENKLQEKLGEIKSRALEKRKIQKAPEEEKCNWNCVYMTFKLHELYHEINKNIYEKKWLQK